MSPRQNFKGEKQVTFVRRREHIPLTKERMFEGL